MKEKKRLRVLYSYPYKIGADRICYTAWQQVYGAEVAGAEMLVFPGVIYKPFPASVKIRPTLSWRSLRISYKLIGSMRASILHDFIVSRRIKKLVGQIDIIHVWSLGALQTLKVASMFGIPTVLERPNAHTRFAYEVVQRECEKLGVSLPHGHEHAYNEQVLKREEAEYNEAFRILCPSDFVVKTYIDKGFPKERLIRHIYGYDEKHFYPLNEKIGKDRKFTILFVGVCAVRKGVHYALEAWLNSSAHQNGTFLIAGEFLPDYANKLSSMLSHPSIKVLGHRNDIPELMRNSDVLILPSIEEGFGLVCTEAMGSGCVPIVSDACTEICKHMENSLVHHVGDTKAITDHINLLYEDRTLLNKLRSGALQTAPSVTWSAAGERLLKVYSQIISKCKS